MMTTRSTRSEESQFYHALDKKRQAAATKKQRKIKEAAELAPRL
jgi:hypothetical protein